MLHTRTLLLIALIPFLAGIASAQTTPDKGTPPHGTFGGGPDIINLANLNVNIKVPVFHKPGRGLHFDFDLAYNSSVWSVVGTTGHYAWQPTTNWGWTNSGSDIGTLTHSVTNTTCYVRGLAKGYYTTWPNWVYQDGSGTPHPFGGGGFGQTIGCSGGAYSIGFTLHANDGSGYVLTTTGDCCQDKLDQIQVTSPEGTLIVGGTIRDPNGNEITTDSSGNLTDSLGIVTMAPSGTSPNPVTYTYPAPLGASAAVTVTYKSYTVQTNFGCAIAEYGPTSNSLVDKATLQDNTFYQLNYEITPGDIHSPHYVTGRLASVTLPTGGIISYSYTGGNQGIECVDGSTAGLTRTTPDGTWNYTRTMGTYPASTTTITDPQGNQSVMQFVGNYQTVNQVYQGSSSSGTLLKTTSTCYDGLTTNCTSTSFGTPISQRAVTIQLGSNGPQCKHVYFYDSTTSALTEVDDYDYGSGAVGPLLKKTLYNSGLWGTATKLFTLTVQNGAGTQIAQTNYNYDETTPVATSGLPQHIAVYKSRGNLTSQSQWLNTTGALLTSHWTYYDTGMVNTATDPNNHSTTYSYSTAFAGAYPTTVTNALNQNTTYNYDLRSGVMTSMTDPNSQQTTYSWDSMLRATNVTPPSPDGGQTNFYYPNTTTVEMQKSIDGTRMTDSFTYFDGLGRESRSMSANDESNPWDQVDTCYDAVGRVGFKSYPYQGNGLSTPKVCSGAGDAFTYDPLNRVTQVTHSDGSTILTSYTGRATQVQDEGNGSQRAQRISQVDGLGRLTSLCEVSSGTQLGAGGTPAACGQDIAGTGFLTTYGYDGLSNLTNVSQGGYLPRTFAYDSLSRLLSAANPESGTTTYGYDNASRLTTRTAPKPSQTNPSVTVTNTMAYDEINRLRTKTYTNSDNSTTYLAPAVTLNYDQTSALGVSGLLNTIGRESSAVVAGSQAGEVFSYDKLGRVKINSQCTPQNCSASTVFPITYNYDLLGDMTSGTNGMGVTLTYTVNRAQRLTGTTSTFSDPNHPATLYSSPHYNGAGSVLSAIMGNPGSSVSETRSYDGRLRLNNITDGSLYTLTIPTNGYAPNSDILLANDSVNGNWTYGYDAFNRLVSANATGQVYTYDYDRFGNRWHQNGPHSSSLSFSANNNRMDTYSYDAAGNLLNDGTTTYTYDSENRIISATNSTSGTSTYQYDADGRRIRKTTTVRGAVDFLYDLGGHEITEVTSAGLWWRGELYAGGRHLGTYSNGTTYFTFSDWLGTERARSTSTGAPYETCTSLPFGDWLTCTGSFDSSPMHFTGKERDSESGLDNFGARYDSSQYGRFMSPDPSDALLLRALFPQRWNMYAYAINNPLSYTDPTGKDAVAVNFGGMVGVAGHEAILVIGSDGSTTFASFGPMDHSLANYLGAAGPGLLTVANSTTTAMSSLPTVQFAANGLPTSSSVATLINAVAKIENVDPTSVELNYFKTSDADTQTLRNYVDQERQAIAEGHGPFCLYNVVATNCADFAAAGLLKGSAITATQFSSLSPIPNIQASQLSNITYTFDLMQLMLNQDRACVSASDSATGSTVSWCY